MSDTLRAAAEQALEALEHHVEQTRPIHTTSAAIDALRAALAAAEPAYRDSTPHLNVGNSAFESWFQAQPFATQIGIKQISRDSYAAGMGDPLVVAAAVAEPVAHLWQHSETGRTRVVMPDQVVTADAPWLVVGPLYLAPPQREPQWVPVAERLPEKFTEVLVAFAGQMSIASTGQYTNSPHDKNGWCYPAENNGICDDGSDPVVTHWMPLPDAPASAPKEQP